MMVIADGDYRSNPFCMFEQSIADMRKRASLNAGILRRSVERAGGEWYEALSPAKLTAGRVKNSTRQNGVGQLIGTASFRQADGSFKRRRLYVRVI
jgi:hypothetical protein